MKTIKMTIAAWVLLLFAGCAQFGPATVDPAVYKSSRNAMVAGNQLRKEEAETRKANERLNQKLIEEWEKAIMAGSAGNDQTTIIDENGMRGGLDCLFTNASSRDKLVLATKQGGYMDKRTFRIRIKRNNEDVYKLPPGQYRYTWLTEEWSYTYPHGGPYKYFEVTVNPHLTTLDKDKRSKDYHGGVLLYD